MIKNSKANIGKDFMRLLKNTLTFLAILQDTYCHHFKDEETEPQKFYELSKAKKVTMTDGGLKPKSGFKVKV